jgi:hypothetical protein
MLGFNSKKKGAPVGNQNAKGNGSHLGVGRSFAPVSAQSYKTRMRVMSGLNLGLGAANSTMGVLTGNNLQAAIGGAGLGIGTIGMAGSFNKKQSAKLYAAYKATKAAGGRFVA